MFTYEQCYLSCVCLFLCAYTMLPFICVIMSVYLHHAAFRFTLCLCNYTVLPSVCVINVCVLTTCCFLFMSVYLQRGVFCLCLCTYNVLSFVCVFMNVYLHHVAFRLCLYVCIFTPRCLSFYCMSVYLLRVAFALFNMCENVVIVYLQSTRWHSQ